MKRFVRGVKVSPEGKAAMLKLAEWADVVVQNFRPGVTQRLGLDYESLRKVNPKIIYANISAYGTSGSMATKRYRHTAVLLASVLGLALFGLINALSTAILRRWHSSEQ